MARVTNSRAISNVRFVRKYLSAAVLKSFRDSHSLLNFLPFRRYGNWKLRAISLMPVLNYVYAIYGNLLILVCIYTLVNDYLKKTFTYLHIVLLIIRIIRIFSVD